MNSFSFDVSLGCFWLVSSVIETRLERWWTDQYSSINNVEILDYMMNYGNSLYVCFLKIQYVKHGNHPWVWAILTLSHSASYSCNEISSHLVCGIKCLRQLKVIGWRKVCKGKWYQISLSNLIFMTKPKACFTVISEMAVSIMTFIKKVFPNKGFLLLCHIHIYIFATQCLSFPVVRLWQDAY